jgi:hypothetical protein
MWVECTNDVSARRFLCLVLFEVLLAAPAFAGDGTAVVVVAVPESTDAAMVEALHRLRGEATAVGFEVRLVSLSKDRTSAAELDRLWTEAHPAAVVTLAPADGPEGGARSLDVTFADHPGADGVSVAHLTAADAGEERRADVILAVRAVDFIRARMFDALVDRRDDARREGRADAAAAVGASPLRQSRFHAAAGVLVLAPALGFAPSVTPSLALGYLPWPWLRLRAIGFGLGTRPTRQSKLGQVSLDQSFVGADVALLARRWWRLQPLVSLSAGEYWVQVQGEASAGNVLGRTLTRSSPAAEANLGLALDLGRGFACEIQAGTLWLQSRVHVATETEDLGSVGRPAVLVGLMLSAAF